MFSLRSNRTMRLQRYGPWIAYHDPGSHSVFWYNHEQSKGQWETPDIVRQWKSTENGQDSFDKVSPECFLDLLFLIILSIVFLSFSCRV
jgi:hypothetical protein